IVGAIMTLINRIENLWDQRETWSAQNPPSDAHAIQEVIELLDQGQLRVAEKHQEKWMVQEWIKKAILLYFRRQPMEMIEGGPESSWYDKVPSKFFNWDKAKFDHAGFRAVPGSFVRKGSFIAPRVVLMPSFVNIGAYVGEGTMVDTWSTIGS